MTHPSSAGRFDLGAGPSPALRCSASRAVLSRRSARRLTACAAFWFVAGIPAAALAEPVVLAPQAGAESSYRRSVIEWQSVPGKSTYHLEIDDDPNFRSPEVDAQVTGTSYDLAGTPLKPYFAAPYGDMMIGGCFGLLRAFADVYPDAREAIDHRLGVLAL